MRPLLADSERQSIDSEELRAEHQCWPLTADRQSSAAAMKGGWGEKATRGRACYECAVLPLRRLPPAASAAAVVVSASLSSLPPFILPRVVLAAYLSPAAATATQQQPRIPAMPAPTDMD